MLRITTLAALFLALTIPFISTGQISAVGTAQSYKLPQAVKITVAISVLDKDADGAWDEAEEVAEDIVKEYYLEPYVKSITLGATLVQHEYDRVRAQNAYRSTKHLTLVMDSLEIFEKVMEDLLNEGATQVTQVELMMPNQEEIMQNLIDLAIEDAKKKAQAMAGATHIKLGSATGVEVMPGEPSKSFKLKVDPMVSFEGLRLNKALLEVKVKVTFAISK